MTLLEGPDPAIPVRQTAATRLRRLLGRLTAPCKALLAAEMWPARRIVGEATLSVVLGLVAAFPVALSDAGPVRAAAIGLAAAVLSALRRVLPATVLVLAVIGMAKIAGFIPLVCVAAWSAGRRIDGVGRAVWTFIGAYVLAVGLAVAEEPRTSPQLLALAALVTLTMTVVPGLGGRYLSQRRTLAHTLGEYNAQLLREREMVADQARMRERQRIAQDMHDSLGHQLALVSVHTGALEVNGELTDRQREAVGVLREASVTAMRELREVVGLLRDGTQQPDAEETGAAARGVAGIPGLVDASRGTGADVKLLRSGEPHPLGPAADHAAYRVVQEGLTNTHKHAPGASVTVALRYEPDSLVVEVTNGPAPDRADSGGEVVSGSQGLTGLGERTRLLGGMVHAASTPDGGFRLAGVLPYASAEDGTASPRPESGATTFVGPAHDLRQQPPAGSPGDGVPAIDGDGMPKELVKAMSRSTRRSNVAIGCGVAAAAGVLLLAGLVVGGVFLFKEADKAMIEPEQYDAVKVGQPESEVRAKLPSGDTFMADGLDKGAPPEPSGASCLTLMSTELGSMDTEPVFRFCFRDGELIEKKSFDVRM